jgi:hypothetical protein
MKCMYTVHFWIFANTYPLAWISESSILVQCINIFTKKYVVPVYISAHSGKLIV